MLTRLFSSVLALCLCANLVFGCAAMAQAAPSDEGGAAHLAGVSVIMADCHGTASSSQKRSGSQQEGDDPKSTQMSLACKTLCNMIIAPVCASQTHQVTIARPDAMPPSAAPTWDSSVDPPHPRLNARAI